MYIQEEIAVMMVKERMQEAARHAEQMRSLRAGRAERRPLRVRLGVALVRIGHRLMGEHHGRSPGRVRIERARP